MKEQSIICTSTSGENAQADGRFDFGVMIPITHLSIPLPNPESILTSAYAASKHGWNSPRN
ncbi:MAG TPA: hypothetical protein VE521_03950 [Nitrososphaera sp.]|nr:hypothetical protein [Nitrososphaera sp.]